LPARGVYDAASRNLILVICHFFGFCRCFHFGFPYQLTDEALAKCFASGTRGTRCETQEAQRLLVPRARPPKCAGVRRRAFARHVYP
jgi:hypothetical protein